MMKVEDQKEEDVIPYFEIDDDNVDDHGLNSEYENGNEMTKDEGLQRLWILKNLTTGYACIIMMDNLLT